MGSFPSKNTMLDIKDLWNKNGTKSLLSEKVREPAIQESIDDAGYFFSVNTSQTIGRK